MLIFNIKFFLIVFTIIVYIAAFVYFRVKRPYESASKHRFISITVAMLVCLIYSLDGFSHFLYMETWLGLADNIFSGSIFAILLFVFWKYENDLKNKYEDKTKFEISYDKIVKQYYKENLVQIVNIDGTVTTYPVVELGTGCVLLNQRNKNIIIEDDMNDIYQLPTIIENNYLNIFKIHSSSKVFNCSNIRVKSMSLEKDVLKFVTGRTTYFDSLVTNRASDYCFDENLSVRILFENGPRLSNLENSRLSNHLGFNGFVESRDGYIVFVKRSSNLSIGKRTYGDSIGASLKTEYALDSTGKFTVKCFNEAILKEIETELKITGKDLIKSSIVIIAIYRDCLECGKPQFLIYAKSRKNADEITKNFINSVKTEKKNITDKSNRLEEKQIELDVGEDGKKLLWIKKDILKNKIKYESDRIVYIGSKNEEGFVEFKNTKVRSKIQELPMLPSASASVVLFVNGISKTE